MNLYVYITRRYNILDQSQYIVYNILYQKHRENVGQDMQDQFNINSIAQGYVYENLFNYPINLLSFMYCKYTFILNFYRV